MNPPIITLSPVCTKLRVLMLPEVKKYYGAEIVHFHETDSDVLFTPRTIAV